MKILGLESWSTNHVSKSQFFLINSLHHDALRLTVDPIHIGSTAATGIMLWAEAGINSDLDCERKAVQSTSAPVMAAVVRWW